MLERPINIYPSMFAGKHLEEKIAAIAKNVLVQFWRFMLAEKTPKSLNSILN